jgi:hypothetical protein
MKAYLRSKTLRYFPGWEKPLKNPPLEPETPLLSPYQLEQLMSFGSQIKTKYIFTLTTWSRGAWWPSSLLPFKADYIFHKNVNHNQEIHE